MARQRFEIGSTELLVKEGPKALLEYVVGVVPDIVAERSVPLEHE